MPLLDIATPKPSFSNCAYKFECQNLLFNKFVSPNEGKLACSWKLICVTNKSKNLNLGRINVWRGGLAINAIATLEKEPTGLTQSHEESSKCVSLKIDINSASSTSNVVELDSSSDGSAELDKREKLRRLRISRANKGNTPWNKGRKHSPETLQRIKERTRLAMQDPKVRMKLVNLGHAQSEETRIKIGVSVRMGWEKRREKLKLQETCVYEWQNLIAEASRRGVVGEEELQWDSYKILNKQLKQEWLQSVERRKQLARPVGNKRAPKSAEQRRKISEAIAAKWADPAYRTRVYSGLAKYHGIPDGIERKPRRKPQCDEQTRKISPSKKEIGELNDSAKPEPKNQNHSVRLKRSKVPKYKDPLADSKLEMLRNIRAERAAAESKKTEAIARAKLLIAEAEEAAKALELAATKSPLAKAALTETRTLIAEAVNSLKSIETGDILSVERDSGSPISDQLVSPVEEESDAESQSGRRIINGAHASVLNYGDVRDLNFDKVSLHDFLNGNGNGKLVQSSSSFGASALVNGKLVQPHSTISSDLSAQESEKMLENTTLTRHADTKGNGSKYQKQDVLPNGLKSQSKEEEMPPPESATKTWVRGRLVEVAEGDW